MEDVNLTRFNRSQFNLRASIHSKKLARQSLNKSSYSHRRTSTFVPAASVVAGGKSTNPCAIASELRKWDGKYPTYYMGGGAGGPNLLLQMPAPTETAVSAGSK